MIKTVATLLIVAYCNLITASPCDDSTYISLNGLDTLSKTEMILLSKLQTECTAYQDSVTEAQQDSVEQIEKEKNWAKRKPLIITGIAFGVVGMITLFAIMINATDGEGSWYISF